MAKKEQLSKAVVRAAKKAGTAKKTKSATRKAKSKAEPAAKTSEQKLAEKKALAMWGLLSEGGQAYGGKLKPRIDEPARVALEQAGLVEVAKISRAFLLTVTDKGWDWAEQNLDAPLPKTVSGAAILQSWLTRLQSFLRTRDLRLSELFAEPPPASSNVPLATTSPSDTELRERIRSAYCEVGGGFNRRVLLRDLRKKLVDVDRALVDIALIQMLRDEEATLMQLDYRPDVSAEDHAAALQIGNEPRHIIWISK